MIRNLVHISAVRAFHIMSFTIPSALLTIAYRTHPLLQTVLRENYAFKYPCIHVPHRVLERHVTVYDRIFHMCQ